MVTVSQTLPLRYHSGICIALLFSVLTLVAVPPEATETLAQLVGGLTPLLPAADIDSDDDEYY